MTRRYALVLVPDPDEGGYTVRVPTLAGLTTEGDSLEEAFENARDAIRLYLQDMEAHGEPAPEEKAQPQVLTIDAAA